MLLVGSESNCFNLFENCLKNKFLKISTQRNFSFIQNCLSYQLGACSELLYSAPWTVAYQTPLSFTVSQSLFKFMFTESVMLSNHLILCHFLLPLPSIFPSTRVFTSESALHIKWPKFWSFSLSVSPSKEYSGLISFRIDWISLQSKGLSRVFSNITVQKHQFFGAQPSLWSNSHICM